MSKKYKELPAFETNKFKEKDFVAVYGHHLLEDGDVLQIQYITDSYVKLEKEDGSRCFAHFKQCRKLEEIKPRVIWVNEESIIVSKKMEIDLASLNIISDQEVPNWTKFVEILE